MKNSQDQTSKFITAAAIGGLVSLIAPSLYVGLVLLIGNFDSGMLSVKKFAVISVLIFLFVFLGTLFFLRKK